LSHWDGIASYCKPENNVLLGCVEKLNNTICVIQRKAYGFHDEQYLPLFRSLRVFCYCSRIMQKSPTHFRVEPIKKERL